MQVTQSYMCKHASYLECNLFLIVSLRSNIIVTEKEYMNKLTTTKQWKEVLPEAAVKTLTNALDAHRQHTQALTGKQISQEPCSILLYGGDSEKRKAAAVLAGVHTGQQVYQISLPDIVSKYIGETEKNLTTVFAKAHEENWLLFFDEADSLFNKRTAVKDSHDKYANIEINYLMQQIEKYKNPVVVACNEQPSPAILQSFGTAIQFPAGYGTN